MTMTLKRNEIETLDPRQIEYCKYHNEEYGTDQLVISGKTYLERTAENRPTQQSIREAMNLHTGYECYLWNNKRGWAVVFRTEVNEAMFDWDNLEYLGASQEVMI